MHEEEEVDGGDGTTHYHVSMFALFIRFQSLSKLSLSSFVYFVYIILLLMLFAYDKVYRQGEGGEEDLISLSFYRVYVRKWISSLFTKIMS